MGQRRVEPRRPPQRAETRADIDAVLVACLELLIPDPDQFSVKAAAAAAGVRPSYLYDHVGDTPTLLERVRSHAVGRLMASLAAVPSGLPAEEAAKAVAGALIQDRQWRGHLMALLISPWRVRQAAQDEVSRIMATCAGGRYREWLAGGIPGVAMRGPALAGEPSPESARQEIALMTLAVLSFVRGAANRALARKEL